MMRAPGALECELATLTKSAALKAVDAACSNLRWLLMSAESWDDLATQMSHTIVLAMPSRMSTSSTMPDAFKIRSMGLRACGATSVSGAGFGVSMEVVW